MALCSNSIEKAVRRWHSRWCVCLSEHRGPGRFGETRYWEERYQGGLESEWFLPAEAAAESAAREYCSFKRGKSNDGVRILHLGCGTSLLGLKICQKLRANGICIDSVLNTDCSETALRRLRELSDKTNDSDRVYQDYQCWDATQRTSTVNRYNGSFDLILDKGTLDALQFAGGDPLVQFFTTIHTSCTFTTAPMYIHWSDDDPDMKIELLSAAFPKSMGWQLSWTQEEESPDDEILAENSSSSRQRSLFDWTYYRYVATRNIPPITQ